MDYDDTDPLALPCCANCALQLPATCIASYSLPSGKLSVHQGLELIFKCHNVKDAGPCALKFCSSCGHLFGQLLKFYTGFKGATAANSYVQHFINDSQSISTKSASASPGRRYATRSVSAGLLDQSQKTSTLLTTERRRNVRQQKFAVIRQEEDDPMLDPLSHKETTPVLRWTNSVSHGQDLSQDNVGISQNLSQDPYQHYDSFSIKEECLSPEEFSKESLSGVVSPSEPDEVSLSQHESLAEKKISSARPSRLEFNNILQDDSDDNLSDAAVPSRSNELISSKKTKPELRTFRCKCCDLEFVNGIQCRMHERSHSELRPFECSHCDRNFRTRDGIQKHIKRGHPADYIPKFVRQPNVALKDEDRALLETTQYKCDSRDCAGVSFKALKDWALHQHAAHAVDTGYDLEDDVIVPVKGKLRPCPRCGKTARTQWRMLQHIRDVHLGLRPFKCATCNKGFVSKLSLEGHTTAAHGNGARNFLCGTCGLAFVQKGTLRAHEKVHIGEPKPFVCKTCGSQFRRPHELEDHQNVHKGVTFPCDYCDKAYPTNRCLDQHRQRMHTKKAKFDKACDLCGKAYRYKHDLRLHYTGTHKMCDTDARQAAKMGPPSTRDTTHDKPKACEFCDRKYVRREQLFTHLVTRHGKSQEEAKSITGLETKRKLISSQPKGKR